MKKPLTSTNDASHPAICVSRFFLSLKGLLLSLLLILPAFTSQATNYKFILWESFEEIATPALPVGWTRVNLNGDAQQWETNKYGGLPARHQCVRYNGTSPLPANDWLFTPPMSLSPGILYTLTFQCKVSPGSTQRMKICVGNAPDPGAMVTQLYDNPMIINPALQEFSVDFIVPVPGDYFLGFLCYSNPGQNQFFLDDIQVSCQSSELNLKFALTKKLLDPSATPAYAATEAIEGYAVIENASTGILVLNTSFNVGSVSESGYELSYIVTPPDGIVLQFVLRSEPEPFSTSHKFEMVEPGKVKGRYEDIQKLFRFTQTGTYTVQAVYRSYYKSPGYDVWLGKLVADPVIFTIQ